MSLDQAMPWVLMFVGILGFELAGRKIWWAWYVNIANQVLWLVFALITGYWGFVVGTIFYTYQFGRNAYKWTKEHFEDKESEYEDDLNHQPYITLFGCGHISYEHGYACIRTAGHYVNEATPHGYAGTFWENDQGYYTHRFNGRTISSDD